MATAKRRSSSRVKANGGLKDDVHTDRNESPSSSTTTASSSVSVVTYEEEKLEFGGSIGAFAIIFLLPLVIYALYYLCNKDVCYTFTLPWSYDWTGVLNKLPKSFNDIYSSDALYMYLLWMGFHVVCEKILPGEVVEGVILENGRRLKYTMSGHLQFWLTIIVMGHGIPTFVSTADGVYNISRFNPFRLDRIYDNYIQLITVSIIGSAILSIYLYTSSFLPNRLLAKGGNTGNVIYDFFIGRELNPRIGSLDLKEFCELRPGLIGWMTINLGMAIKQAMNNGSVSLSMALTTLFQGYYVWDALYQEKAILTTMDITTDGFGYMLAFGDLSWVPFVYSLQARYLVDHDPNLKLWQIIIISIVHFAGMYIFRSANSEKDAFRRDPNSMPNATYLQTKRGTRLLTSGWWGAARKINYTGDWIVTLSWCLLCGFDSPIPYFQAIYFAILLIHRADRDDHMCHQKYGDDWLEYKKRVPYMFIPYII